MNQLRIISGSLRGSKISFLDREGLRPSPDRVRETVFNWLQPCIRNADCLDLFAGSAAFAFESVSRGAKQVRCIELNADSAACIEDNAKRLGISNITVEQRDAIQLLQNESANKYALVFLDPPFNDDLLEISCSLLEKNAWLKDGAMVYLESDQDLENLLLPGNWSLLKQKKAGRVYFGLCQRSQ